MPAVRANPMPDRPLLPFAAVALMGLWWAVAPRSAIRFYERWGARSFAWLGEGVVRALGVVVLVALLVGVAVFWIAARGGA